MINIFCKQEVTGTTGAGGSFCKKLKNESKIFEGFPLIVGFFAKRGVSTTFLEE